MHGRVNSFLNFSVWARSCSAHSVHEEIEYRQGRRLWVRSSSGIGMKEPPVEAATAPGLLMHSFEFEIASLVVCCFHVCSTCVVSCEARSAKCFDSFVFTKWIFNGDNYFLSIVHSFRLSIRFSHLSNDAIVHDLSSPHFVDYFPFAHSFSRPFIPLHFHR